MVFVGDHLIQIAVGRQDRAADRFARDDDGAAGRKRVEIDQVDVGHVGAGVAPSVLVTKYPGWFGKKDHIA